MSDSTIALASLHERFVNIAVAARSRLPRTPIPPAAITITTQPSSTATNGSALATQPVLQVRDAQGNALAQAGIVVTASIASGGGTLGGTVSVTSSASGIATFTNLSITGTVGARTFSFAASGLTGATSTSITVSAGAASALSITTQPSASAQSGVAFTTQPVVRLVDQSGNTVSQSGKSVTASIASGGGTLGGTATVTTNASGIATFTNLSITGAAGSRTLAFASSGLTGATSNGITVASAATQLVITTQPSASATSGAAFSQQPAVRLQDASGNNVLQSGVVVTAAIATGGGTLGGTLTATTNANGMANFTNLSITGTAGSRTLSFSATGLTSATSNAIAITAAGVPDLAFQDFSNGTIAPFVTDSAGGTTTATVINDPTGSGRGKVLELFYSNSNDANRWVFPDSDPFPKNHLFFGGDLYIPSSTPNFTNPAIQRKLIYCRTEGNPIIAGVVISAWGNTLNYVLVNSVDQPLISTGQTITTDVWHRLEFEVQMNTSPSLSNGIFRLWWDGTQIVNRTNARFYSQTLTAAGYPYDYYSIGYQVEDGASWTERRYWDNLGFATTRIG